MSIKVEKHEDGPSAMMQKREERSERGSFGDRGPRSFGDRDRGDRDRGDRGPRPQRSFEGSAE
jgi:small subunit ribosomal protein S6